MHRDIIQLMALAGGIPVINCQKANTFTLIVKDETIAGETVRRGDPAGTGNFVCSDKPLKEGQAISGYWNLPIIKLDIKVEKKAEEVEDLHDGITVTCQEFDCPFNKGKER